MAQLRHDEGHDFTGREARRGRMERNADDYRDPRDWRPHGDDHRFGSSLLGVLVAGLLLLALIVGLYFVFPSREDVAGVDTGVRVPLPSAPSIDPPSLPEPPSLPPRLGG